MDKSYMYSMGHPCEFTQQMWLVNQEHLNFYIHNNIGIY